MSCNGCRVLRKGCSQACVLRSCLHWIDNPEAQGNATLFLAKFFGRTDLLSFISAVPEHQRPALFQSLLFEVCGRTVNPVSGAVGLLSSGNWHFCKAAVDTVLNGGVLKPMSVVLSPKIDETSEIFSVETCMLPNLFYQSSPSLFDQKRVQEPFDIGLSLTARSFVPATSGRENSSAPIGKRSRESISLNSEEQSAMTRRCSEIGDRKERKLLNLFV